jgi:hypothetical protein
LQIHRLGYSKKGWTDGEIGVEYIKDFHEQTKDKAKARTQVLLVDGHNSHYTLGFLLFARTHRIHVLCYPAHGTHVYQGLDVVIFGPLKVFWTQEKDKWTREKRTKIDKTNFLRIYAAAHVRALTPSNIKAAFEKTGVVPFNPRGFRDLNPTRKVGFFFSAIVDGLTNYVIRHLFLIRKL